MKNYKRIVATLLIGALLGFSALGCNTFKGAGKDIQSGGKSVENAATGAEKK